MLNRFTLRPVIWLIFSFFSGLFACSDPQSSNPGGTPSSGAGEATPIIESYIETGDLDAIKQQGKLRILTRYNEQKWLPRQGRSFNEEQELARKFAQHLKLEPVFIYVDKFEDLIPELNAGRGDIIAANLTITSSRKERLQFSVPLLQSREHIVSRANEKIGSLKQLNGRTIALQAETAYQETANELKLKYKNIEIQQLPGDLSGDQILDLLNAGKIDLTIMDNNLLQVFSGYRNDFKIGPALTRERALAWAIRKDSPQLLAAVNHFLTREQFTRSSASRYTDDFDSIKKRRTLRVITRNNAASYFIWRGELLGFEYELAKAFAKQHKLRLEIITAPDHESQIPMLLEGKGDIIASFMTITETREKQGITFSRPHHKTSEILVTRANDSSLQTVADLAGRKVYVRKSSAYRETLQKLRDQGINFEIIDAPEDMETEEIIAQVASGDYDLTLADSHLLDIELTWRDDIRAAFPLNEARDNAWAMRSGNPQLIRAVNQFIKKQYKSLFYNVTYDKYFKNAHRIKKYRSQRIDLNPDGTLSPYDSIVKKYAQQYNFDWRLLVAQMYQESRFNPRAKSWVGAQGLMQVMPRTAKELGITNLKDPESGIKAGVKYLNWVRDRFEEELDVKDRMWFALASYNAGQGHVKDARRLARQKGLNPDRWFDHVEKAMLLLAKRKYARKARHGYVRGIEPVNYVREIRSRYRAYIRLAGEAEHVF